MHCRGARAGASSSHCMRVLLWLHACYRLLRHAAAHQANAVVTPYDTEKTRNAVKEFTVEVLGVACCRTGADGEDVLRDVVVGRYFAAACAAGGRHPLVPACLLECPDQYFFVGDPCRHLLRPVLCVPALDITPGAQLRHADGQKEVNVMAAHRRKPLYFTTDPLRHLR